MNHLLLEGSAAAVMLTEEVWQDNPYYPGYQQTPDRTGSSREFVDINWTAGMWSAT